MDWGHSSNVTGVDFASRARVRRLAIFHHDPAASDKALDGFLRETKSFLRRRKNTYLTVPEEQDDPKSFQLDERFPDHIILSYDGLVLKV